MFSIPSLANVFMLLMLIFFMFAVSGNSLFREVKRGDVIDDLKNFGDFASAFVLLFAVSTGEDWNKIMFDCSR
jgi:voltage-gated sodium channel type XI alpha